MLAPLSLSFYVAVDFDKVLTCRDQEIVTRMNVNSNSHGAQLGKIF